jgi:hypothetical protein
MPKMNATSGWLYLKNLLIWGSTLLFIFGFIEVMFMRMALQKENIKGYLTAILEPT